MTPTAAAFRRRAEQCRRFADQLDLSADPSVPALRDMAAEYEAAARALETPVPRFIDGPLTLRDREPDRRSTLR
ncbi:hypothetical protein HNR00_001691 [Methylorubrum rhodinum]|uniref:Uncharacterized protein n=1 Tax=Methylorubrum rhodinum TaxID=29428 RepID=A0A840ZJH7_9HYPH|nr:hypothetical protein [Methylorubrum rhodinum]MBB5756983.1 hypothetical protein [Methylorubrum rhodinum]